MYEDNDLWPVKCPACGEEFTKQVGWLKTHDTVKCPGTGCPTTINVPREGFALALAQARDGRFDPYGEMMRLSKNSSS
jgi:hypothetical protein